MPAILGVLGANQLPIGWERAIAAMGARSHAEPRRIPLGRADVVFCGGPRDAHQAPSDVGVLVDGRVENLTELCRKHGVSGQGSAESLSALFRVRSVDLFAELEGSFAVVFVDQGRNEVHLVRDRHGTRPLFYRAVDDGWAFASECAMLLPLSGPVSLDPSGFAESMQYRWLVGDRTLFADVEQVLPSCWTRLSTAEAPRSERHHRQAFRPAAPQGTTLEEWTRRTEEVLHRQLDRVLRPGARVAVLLSGGVDSSLLGRFVADHAEGSILLTPTWSDFDDPELPRAKEFARLIGSEHRILSFDGDCVDAMFSHCVARLEQPPRHQHALTLAAMIPALQEFDVVVYGEAADTMFGSSGVTYLQKFDRKRRWARVFSSFAGAARRLPNSARSRALAQLLEFETADLIRRSGILTHAPWFDRQLERLAMSGEPNPRTTAQFLDTSAAIPERFQSILLGTEIVSHMETVDRLFTPVELEIVAPFLSPDVVDFASTLPHDLKGTRGVAKPILKALSARHFTTELAYAPKLGFPTPVRRWLQHELGARVQQLKAGTSPMARIFPAETLKRLMLPADIEAIWTLIALDELVRRFDVVNSPVFS